MSETDVSYDLYRREAHTINFLPFSPARTISIPEYNKTDIQDVFLKLHFSPSSQNSGTFGDAPSELKFYIDNKELTPFLLSEIKYQIEQIDDQEGLVRSWYDGMQAYYLTMEKILPDSHRNHLNSLRNEINHRRNTSNLTNAINSLGETDMKGILHPVCYLYSYIRIPSISLKAVFQRYNAGKLENEHIFVKNAHTATFSHGSHIAVSSIGFEPEKAAGTVHIELDYQYSNQLANRMELLEEQFETMQDEISDSLGTIIDMLSSDGDIMMSIDTINNKLQKAELAIEQSKDKYEDYASQIKNIRVRLEQM
ncbi:hypothetical protein [Pseudoalteromonas lipolytica]|uniref:hypothetical protein n=1 Tax=Pseudoalteromonas lipolytica TaxID=570156 RepID=UPI00241D4AAE|nr:hypothetical protein [Pseudoalteromonas lipolytica]|tara:strand:+ start:256 stop:1185 length:930 start_codon:yes stop_codon:yes gene_type:complete